jgi:ATP-dependent exoDNAse (exonuclease V) beta subunit
VDSDVALREGLGEGSPGGEEAAARGIAVHALLEWSRSNGWREPPAELIGRISASAEVGADSELPAETLLEPLRAWLGSGFFDERVREERSRAEVPLLIEVAGTVLRGSIDLLVEEDGAPPLIVDYKTDRVDGTPLAELAARYEIQQAIYALAVTEAKKEREVELAYVFLERPEEPVVARWGPDQLEEARRLLEGAIARARGA